MRRPPLFAERINSIRHFLRLFTTSVNSAQVKEPTYSKTIRDGDSFDLATKVGMRAIQPN